MLLVLKKSEMQPAEPPIYAVAVAQHMPGRVSTSHYHGCLMGLKLQT
jgi:hypothetical protein